MKIEVYKSGEFVETLEFAGSDVIRIGRLKSSHLMLEDEAVARRHCVIETSAGGWDCGPEVRVIDLGSTEGTKVNGARVEKNALVGTGDKITIGPYDLVLRFKNDPTAAATPREEQRFPRVVYQGVLTKDVSAAIMGGNYTHGNTSKEHNADKKIRIVQTGERRGWPIFTIEEAAGEPDAMGVVAWQKADLPYQIALAFFVNGLGEKCDWRVMCQT